MKAFKFAIAGCMAIGLSAYFPEQQIKEIKATEAKIEIEEKWSGTVSSTTPKNDGNTYHIYTGEELAWMAEQTQNGFSFEGKTIVLENDIDLDFIPWNPIGVNRYQPFMGIFDGNGKEISNLMLYSYPYDSYVGLFGVTKNGTLKDFSIKNVKFQNSNSSYKNLGIVSADTLQSKIINVTVDNAVITSTSTNIAPVGGITCVLSNSSWIINCTIKNSTLQGRNPGGIVSDWEPLNDEAIFGKFGPSGIINCASINNQIQLTYPKKDESFGGGIVANINTAITDTNKIGGMYFLNNYATGTVSVEKSTNSNSAAIGGLIGAIKDNYSNPFYLANCYTSSVITNNSDSSPKMGSIIGYNANLQLQVDNVYYSDINSDLNPIGEDLADFSKRMNYKSDADMKKEAFANLMNAGIAALDSSILPLADDGKRYTYNSWYGAEGVSPSFIVPAVTEIEIYPTLIDNNQQIVYINQGSSAQLHAVLKPYRSDRAASASWRVSPDTSGVIVDADGLVSAGSASAGTEVDLIASYGEITKSIKVRILEKDAITSLRINSPDNLMVGSTKRLSVTTTPVNADRSSVKWYIDLNPNGLENLVSESETASIDSDTGTIKGLKAGQVTVVAKIEGTSIRDSYTMTIQDTSWDGASSRQPEFYDNAYHITMASELKWLAESTLYNGNNFAGKTILLETDLSMGGDLGYSWEPIGDEDTPFSGTFNGQGYMISDLSTDDRNGPNGLFGKLVNAEISNLVLNKFKTIDGVTERSGALAGCAENTVISNITVLDASIHARGTSGGLLGEAFENVKIDRVSVLNAFIEGKTAGGLLGRGNAYNTSITNSSVTGSIKDYSSNTNVSVSIGGLVGTIIGISRHGLESSASTAFTIQNSYAHTTLSSTYNSSSILPSYTGGLIGSVNSYIIMENNYSSTSITNHLNINAPGGIIGNAESNASYYISIINNSWNEDASFNNTNGEIETVNKKGVGTQKSIVIGQTTLEDMMLRHSEAYMTLDSSKDDSLVNDLNANLPESEITMRSWTNTAGSYPVHTDEESYTVVLKDDYVQMRRNEEYQLEPILVPFISGKELSYEYYVQSGSPTITVNSNGLISVSKEAITHQTAIIEMIAKEKNKEIARDTVYVTVLADEAEITSMSIHDPGIIKTGDQVQFSAEIEPDTVDSSQLYWRLKKVSDIAEISHDGLFIAKRAGTVTVQAILNGVIAERVITVKAGTKWDGITIEEPDSSGNYFYITKPSELAWIAQQTNADRYNGFEGKTILLQNDIDLNNQNWAPIGTGLLIDDTRIIFKGNFDGKGHTIKNLSITEDTGAVQIGLFGIIENSMIQNLMIDTVYINCDTMDGLNGFGAGSLFGWANNSHVANIKVTNAFLDLGTAPAETPMPGGIGGDVNNVEIINCSVVDSVIAGKENSLGGIIGEVRSSSLYFSMQNCHTKNVVIRDGRFTGGLVGYIGQTTESTQQINIQNSYADVTFEFTDKFSMIPTVGAIAGTIAVGKEVHFDNLYGVSKYINSSNRSLIAGDILGKNNISNTTMNNIYYNTETSGLNKAIGSGNTPASTNVSGLKTSVMKDASGSSGSLTVKLNNWVKSTAGSYSTWSVMNNDYPSFGIPEIKSIKVLPEIREVYPGETLRLEKEILPFGAKDVEVKFKSNNSKVTVDNNGLVKVSSDFTATYVAVITMTPVDSKYPSSTSTLIVMPPAAKIESLFINKPDKVEIDHIYTMSAEYLPEDADVSQIRWSLEKGETEAVISEKGILDTGSTAGTVTIRAESKQDSTIYDEISLNIEAEKDFGTVWDGTTEVVNAADNVIHIQNPKQLAYIAQQTKAGKTYEGVTIFLDADLDLGNVNWMPIGNITYPFKGSFEGNNHTVKNLSIKTNTGVDDFGLFGYCQNSVIQNLTVNSVYIKVNKYTASSRIDGYGSIVGFADGIHLENIHVSDIYIDSSLAGMVSLTGGLVGTIRGAEHKIAKIMNCSVNNYYTISYPNSTGGLVGEVELSNIPFEMKNSYSKNVTIVDGTYAAGLIGWLGITDSYSLVENCYTSNLKVINNGNTSGLLYAVLLRNGDKITNNCYGDGSYENKTNSAVDLYGLFASARGATDSCSIIFNNCYYPSEFAEYGSVESVIDYSLINTKGLSDNEFRNNVTQTPNLVNKLNDWVKAQSNSDDYLTWRVNESTPDLGPKSSIVLDQNALILKSNETAVLKAAVVGQNINSIVAWSSSQPSVASIDANGKITAKIPGRAVITATSQDGQTAQASIEVKALTTSVILSIVDSNQTTQLKVGDSLDLQAALQPIEEALTWSSSDPGILSVEMNEENDQLAHITAIKAGTATISAEAAGGAKGSMQFTIGNPVTSVSIEGNVTMDLSHPSQKLKAIVNDDATDPRISWTVKKKTDEIYTETEDAEITQAGQLTVKALGSYRVTAAAVDGTDKKAELNIEVVPAVVDTVKIILPEGQSYLSGQIGSIIDLNAEVTPSLVLPEDAQLHYESSDPDRFEIIEADGQIKVKISEQAKIGDLAQITLTSGIGKDNTVTDTVTVMVAWTKVTGLTIINADTLEAYSEGSPTALGKGSIVKLKAKPTPESATNPSVTWQVENVDESIQTPLAEIDENGYLTLKTPGEIRVSAASLEDGTIVANARISIIEIYPSSISILEGSKEIGVDQNIDYLQLTVNFEPQETTNKNLIFFSSNPSVATVDSTGRITFVKENGKNVLGDTEITITPEVDSSLSEEEQAKPIKITIKVSDQVVYVESIEEIMTSSGIELSNAIIRVGDEISLLASYLPSHASARNFKWEVITQEGEEASAVITDSKLTALKAGSALIRCSIEGKNSEGIIETLSIERAITIQEAVARSINFDVLSLTLMPGVSQNVTASVNPLGKVSQKIKWSSPDSQVVFTDLHGSALTGSIEGPVKVKVNEGAVAGQTVTITAESEALDADGKPLCKELQVFIGSVKATAVTPNRTAISMVAESDGQKLSAIVYGANGLKATNQNVTWKSDHPEIASIDAKGMVMPHRAGTAKITVTSEDGGYSADCIITVSAAGLKELTISETSLTMIKGNEKECTAIVNEGSGVTEFLWESNNPSVAEVKGNGNKAIITAKMPGTASISVTAKGKQAFVVVRVVNDEVLIQSIELSGPNSGEVGQTILVTAAIKGINDQEATNKTLKWSVSDTDAVTVLDETSSIGRFKINKEAGDVTITAEACDGSKASSQLTLKTTGITASGLTLNSSFVKLGSKDTLGIDIIASITPDSVADKSITWTVDKQNIIELTANGSSAHIRPASGVIPNENSYAIITAKTANGKSAQCVVLITEVKLEAIQLGKAEMTIIEGFEDELPVQIKPIETTNTELIWEIDEGNNGNFVEISAESAVFVNAMNGIYRVHAQALPDTVSSKTVILRSRAKANPEIISNLCKIVIEENPLASIQIFGPSEILINQTASYSLLADPFNAALGDIAWEVIEEKNLDGTVYVPDDKDENPELKNHIIQIINDGEIKGIKEGIAVLQVKAGNEISAQITLTVAAASTPPSISDNVDEIRIKELPDNTELQSLEVISGEKKRLGAVFYYQNALIADPSASQIIWSSSDEFEDYLSIDPLTGVITAKAASPQPITITATSSYTKQIPSTIEGEADLTVGVQASIEVMVKEQPGLVKSLSLEPSATSLAFNKKQIMNAYVSYTGNKDDLTIKWESSNPTIVKVTPADDPLQASIETFGKAGTAVIMLTVNGITAFANVTVSAEAKTPVTNITVKDSLGNDLNGIIEMKEGTVLQLAAKADEAASNPNLVFSSSEDSIASVDESGLITALKPGVAMITISPSDTQSRVSKTLVIQVSELPEYKISLNKTEITMEGGSSAELVALLNPALGENASIQYEWYISTPDGQPVLDSPLSIEADPSNHEKAVLTASAVNAESTLQVTLKVTVSETGSDDKILTQSCTVHVLETIAAITDIKWTSDKIINDTLTMYLDESGSEESIGIEISADGEGSAYVNWTTSSPEIISVAGNEAGAIFKAIQTGTALITLTSAKGDFTKILTVNVKKVGIKHLDFSLHASKIEVGTETEGFLTLEADPSEKNDSEKARVQFKSSNPEIASVSVNEQGKILITGLKEGKATIIAMSPTDPDKLVTADITVVKPTPLPYQIDSFVLLDKKGKVISTHTEIDSSGKIIVTVPLLTDKSELIAGFEISYKGSPAEADKAEVLVANEVQVSGITVNDYTSTLTYVVKDKANEENIKDYMVLVIDEAIPAKDAEITDFTFKGIEPCITTINGTNITVKVNEDVELNSLIAEFTASDTLSVMAAEGEQISGVTVNDFSKPVTYILFGKNKKSIRYTVNVEQSPQLASVTLKQGSLSMNGSWDEANQQFVFIIPASETVDTQQPFTMEWTPSELKHSGILTLEKDVKQNVLFTYDEVFTRTVAFVLTESKSQSMTVTPHAISIKPNQEASLQAVIEPSIASQKVKYTLQSGSEELLEFVNYTAGDYIEGEVKVKAKSSAPTGASAVIHAESEDDPSLTDEIKVFIIKNNATSVKILGTSEGNSSDQPEIMKVNQQLKLSAEVYAEDELATNQHVQWISSDEAVALVDSMGSVSAVSTGSAVIQAVSADGNKTASVYLKIEPAELEGITMNKSSLLMVKGTSEPLSVQANAGSELGTVSWQSSNEAIATVDQNGNVHAIKAGKAVITAKASGYETSCTVNVVNGDIKISSIELSTSMTEAEAGQTLLIQADVLPNDAGNKILRWTSSDDSVIHVLNEMGSIGAVEIKAGTNIPVMITAEAMDGSGLSSSIMITPIPSTISAVELSSSFIRLGAKDQEGVVLYGSFKPSTAQGTITWSTDRSDLISLSSSEGKSVIIRPQPGVVPQADSYAVVTASSGDIQAQCVVLLSEIKTESILLEPVAMSLDVDEEQPITVDFSPNSATNTAIEWRVLEGDGTIVMITKKGSGYTASGLKAGAVMMQAVNEEGIMSNPIQITVNEEVLTDIKIIGNTTLVVDDGILGETQLSAVPLPASADLKSLTWSSDDESIASVNDNGLVTAVGPGQAEITAECKGISASVTVSVYALSADKPADIPVQSISIADAVQTLMQGEKAILNVIYNQEGDQPTNKAVVWSSSDPLILSVDESTGLINANAAGEATITVASLEDETITDSVTIQVLAPSSIDTIGWENPIHSMIKGEYGEISAAVTSTGDVSALSAVWSSSNPEIISVTVKNDDPFSASIEAKAKGTAVIYLIAGGKLLAQTITVTETELIPVHTIMIDELGNRDYVELTVGETQTLTIHVNEDAANKDLTITSSDETIAVWNGTEITAIASGIAVITITPDDGSNTVKKIFVKVVPIPESEVTLNKSSLVIAAGTSDTVHAEINPDVFDASIQWSCEDDDVILSNSDTRTVSISTNTTKIKTVVLRVSVTLSDKTIVKECSVTLVPSASGTEQPESIEIYDADDRKVTLLNVDLAEASNVVLKANVLPEGAVQYINWTSSDPTIASVQGSNDPIVSVYKTGTAILTASTLDGSIQKSITVSVTNSHAEKVTIHSIKLKADQNELMIGDTASLTVTIDPNTEIDNVLLTASKEGIISIEKTSSGKYAIHALSEGSVDVTAVSTGDLSKKDTIRIVVSKQPAEPILIKEFTLWDEKGNQVSTKSVIDATGKTIVVTVPLLNDKRSLIAHYTLSAEGSVNINGIEQISGSTVNDYQDTVAYTITDKDGNSTVYTVYVINENIPSENGALTSFILNGSAGDIDEAEKKVIVNLNKNTDLSALSAEFTMTNALQLIGAKGVQVSGETVNDYTKEQLMTVVGKNGVSVTYHVLVDIGPSVKSITLTQNGQRYEGQINQSQNKITFSALAGDADLTKSFTAEVTTSALTAVTYDTEILFSMGQKELNLTDAKGRSYTYTLSFNEIQPETELTLNELKIAGTAGVFDGKIIEVALPYGTDMSKELKVDYTSSETAKLFIGGNEVVNGGTALFTKDKVVELTIKTDEKTNTYTLIVKEQNSEGTALLNTVKISEDINEFEASEHYGSYYLFDVPYETDITKLKLILSAEEGAVIKVNGDTYSEEMQIDCTQDVMITVSKAGKADGSYTVKVRKALTPSAEAAIKTFVLKKENQIISKNVLINKDVILVTVPYGTDLSSVDYDFTSDITGLTLSVKNSNAGNTGHDFSTGPITLIAHADGYADKEYTLIIQAESGSAKITKMKLNGIEAKPNDQNELIFSFGRGIDLSSLIPEFTLSDSNAKVLINNVEYTAGTAIDFTQTVTVVIDLNGIKEVYLVKAMIDYGPQFTGTVTLKQGDITIIGKVNEENGEILFDITGEEIILSEPFTYQFTVDEGVQVTYNGIEIQSGESLTFTNLSEVKQLILKDADNNSNTYKLKLYEDVNLPKFNTFEIVNDNVTGILIDHVSGTITIKVKPGTDISQLKPVFTLNEYAQMAFVGTQTQISGVSSHDFSNGVDYLLMGNGRTKAYHVVVVEDIEGPIIYTFGVQGEDGIIYYGKVDNLNNEIIVRMPNGSSRNNLVIYFSSSDDTSVTTGLNTKVNSGVTLKTFTDSAVNFKVKELSTSLSRTYKVSVKYVKAEGDMNDDGTVDQQDVITLASIVNGK